MKQYYDFLWSSKEFPFGKWTGENLRWHKDFFLPYIGKSVLDYGCGDGEFLSRMDIDGTGVDISTVAIDRAKKKFPHLTFKPSLDTFPDGYFDTVFMIDVLEHVPDVCKLLCDMKRLVIPNGHLLIATNELTPVKSALISLFKFEQYFDPMSPHIRFFTRNTLQKVLHTCGFDVIDYKWNRSYFGIFPQGQMVVAQSR